MAGVYDKQSLDSIVTTSSKTFASSIFPVVKLPNTFLGTIWQTNCEMPKKRAKLAIPLHPHLRVVRLRVNSKPRTNITIFLKVINDMNGVTSRIFTSAKVVNLKDRDDK